MFSYVLRNAINSFYCHVCDFDLRWLSYGLMSEIKYSPKQKQKIKTKLINAYPVYYLSNSQFKNYRKS